MVSIQTRPADRNDVTELTKLLNEIIDIGGTTAMENKLSVDEFQRHFVSGDGFISCILAEAEDGTVLGFQALSRHEKLPASWADIATFARVNPKIPGVGTQLFQATLALARRENIDCINATIRADNISGLGYYTKMGFEDYALNKGVPLLDGTPVDRISKKFEICR